MLHDVATRRRALAQLATGATIAALPAAAMATEPVDFHPVWWRRREEIRTWINGAAAGLPAEATDPIFAEGCELEDLIGATPAATLAGVRAQIAMVLHSLAEVGSHNDTDVAALSNVLATVERLTGESAHV